MQYVTEGARERRVDAEASGDALLLVHVRWRVRPALRSTAKAIAFDAGGSDNAADPQAAVPRFLHHRRWLARY
jgi:hypothetical protein